MRKLSIILVIIIVISLGSVGVASAGPDGPKVGGEITEIDLTTGLVTIQILDGETFVIKFTDETEFHSRDESLTDLADLEIGMRIDVRGEEQDDGTILTSAVGAAKKGDVPGGRDGDRRLQSELTDIDGDLPDSGDLVALAVGGGKPPEERPTQVNGTDRIISSTKRAGKFSGSKSNT